MHVTNLFSKSNIFLNKLQVFNSKIIMSHFLFIETMTTPNIIIECFPHIHKISSNIYLSGAERAVALIMVDVCMSVNFLMHLWPGTMLHTSRGRYVCLCS